MQDHFFNGKFNIFNGTLFGNLCKINANQYKGKDSESVELKDDIHLRSRNDKNKSTQNLALEETDSNILSYGNAEKIKKNLNSQLIYSYYNNFATNKYIEYGPDQKGVKNMHTYRHNDSEYGKSEYGKSGYGKNGYGTNECGKNTHLRNVDRINNYNLNLNNKAINKQSNYEHIKNNNKNESLFFKEDNTIYNEFKNLKNDILELQIMNVNLQKQFLTSHILNNSNAIPQHIIINNKTEVASNSLTQLENNNNNNNNNNKKKKGLIYFLLKKILSSKINQMLIVSSFFISIYIAHKHWQRALKIAEIQSKVNSNFILKTVKTIEEMVGIRNR
ncbi:microneme associated antigen, putative [Plasmodium yoelii]|uniref:Microneme associated antigen n=3 Tax=Plasmodium yoelii TaxID=5861 RepID=A0AAE9WJZ2_PLAYO|nr:microneme associated antigen, putative [Plasmodium yoelii]EAA23033.1 hypothetical protein [Plasmodium yoelii yoelii]WBY55383.1 microneme associated antigen [Plasmodium yoelii yoelii]CDU16541.1 microneme associated antigen, putative [Plasmodium yoelii]VTZ73424.1 microneme associated antigen, putative [Plasmodium yoelii]|eukprot:XP_731465.1 microneme associated antigen, putative [Plasmodium yoelii]